MKQELQKLGILPQNEVELLSGIECDFNSIGGVPLSSDPDNIENLILIMKNDHFMSVIYHSESSNKGVITHTFTNNPKLGDNLYFSRTALPLDYTYEKNVDEMGSFSDLVEPLGLYTEKEFKDLLTKLLKDEGEVSGAMALTELNEEGFVLLDSNHFSRRLCSELMDKGVHFISETIEESEISSSDVFCYSNGIRFVNANRIYPSKAPLTKEFCEFI